MMSIAEREQFLANNPHIEQLVVSAPMIGDPFRLGLVKPDEGFRDRLREIKKSHHGSNINVM